MPMAGLISGTGGGGLRLASLFSKSGAFKCPSKEEFDILQDFFFF